MQTIRKLLAALAIVAMLIGGISIAAALIFGDHSKPQQSAATPRTTLAPPPPSVPTPKEFTINVVVTDQNCDPGAGCAYKYTIEPKSRWLPPVADHSFHGEVRGARWHRAAAR